MDDRPRSLTGLARVVEYTWDDPFGLVATCLQFNEGIAVVEFDPEEQVVDFRVDPVVELRQWGMNNPHDVTDDPPWSTFLGAECTRRWLLTAGDWCDGVQLQLTVEWRDLFVQWLGAGNGLRSVWALG